MIEVKEVYVIYCHTNTTNGKKYVGQSKMGLEKRLYFHIRDAYNPNSLSFNSTFQRAIRKYGKDNFTSQILEIVYSVDEANKAEQKWIAHFNSNNTQFGYNRTEGGFNYRKNEEHKEKLRQARFNQPDPRIGTTHSKDSKLKMSKAKFQVKRPNSKSKYLGVTHRRNEWMAYIYVNKKRIHLGSFESEIEAAKRRDIEALKIFGDKAVFNLKEV